MHDGMEDASLLAAYGQKDDQEAFRELVRRHLPLIYGLAKRRLRSAPMAEEVSQNVLCALAKSARQQEKILSLPAWLYRVTEKQIAQTMRTEQRRQAREEEAARRETIVREGQAVSDELAGAVREALAGLPDNQRTLLFLRYYDGQSAEAIGELYGIQPRAAQKRVERATESLRSLVARRGLALPAGVMGAQILSVDAMTPPHFLAHQLAESALRSVPPLSSAATPSWWSQLTNGWTPSTGTLALAAIAVVSTGWLSHQHLFQPSSALAESTPDVSPFNPAIVDNPGLGQVPHLSRAARLAIDDIEGIYRLEPSPREEALERLTVYLRERDDAAYLLDLFTRWTRLDSPRNARVISDLMESEALTDPHRETLEESMAIPLERWMQEDPLAALAWVRALPRQAEAEQSAFAVVLHQLGRENIDAAYDWLVGRTHNREEHVDTLARAIVDRAKDSEAVLHWLVNLPEGEPLATSIAETSQAAGHTKTAVWSATLPLLFDRDPQAVADWLSQLPEGERTTRVLSQIVAHWTASDPIAAAAWATQLQDSERPAAQRAVARVWSASEPTRAMEWALERPSSQNPWELALTVFEEWVPQSSADSREWLDGFQEVEQASALFGMAAAQLTPEEAVLWSQDIESLANQRAVLEQAFYRFGQQSPQDGLAALARVRDPETRALVMHSFGLGWIVRGDKSGFDQWVQALGEDSADFYRAKLAEIDLVAALKPERAKSMVLKLPPSRSRDPLVGRLIERVVHRSSADPEEARAWLPEIQDHATRADFAAIIDRALRAAHPKPSLEERPDVAFSEQSLTDLRERLDFLASR